MSNKTQTFLVSTALLAVGFIVTIVWSSWYTQGLDAMATCVVNTAKTQGYAGDVHSKDAWLTFSPLCK